jgi:hypothetical protein
MRRRHLLAAGTALLGMQWDGKTWVPFGGIIEGV